MSQTGFIDHIGIGVPDLVAAQQYYDGLMSVLGLREWFETGPEGPLNYGPDGALGTQLFFYQAEPGTYSRGQPGLHHLAFIVDDLHETVKVLVAAGYEIAMSARTTNGTEFHFVDTRPTHGHMVELYQRSDRLCDFYAMVAGAAHGWAGDDPVRKQPPG